MPAQNLAQLRAKFEARHKDVTLVADGGLLADHEQATEALTVALAAGATSLAGDPDLPALREHVADLEARIAAGTVTIRVRGIGRNAFRRLLNEHEPPAGSDEPFNPATFPQALIAACSLDPVLTVTEVDELGDLLTDGQFNAVFDAAWAACREVDGIPFSGLVSAATRD